MSSTVKIGTWGGVNGQPRDVPRSPSRLLRVLVYSNGSVINAVKFTYVDDKGEEHDEGPWGAPGDNDAGVVEVGEAGAYLKEISGTYSSYITSLRFVTNNGKQYSYGGASGEAFKIPVLADGHIVGFFGRAGDLLDAIGLYIRP